MKRWLLAGLLGLAILVFLTPGIIGLLAERSLEQQLEQNSRFDPAYAVRQLDFERGWFASEGRHRVPLTDPDLVRFVAQLTPGAGQLTETSALIIETQLEHGLVPLGSAPRDVSALIPALATGVSTLSLELPDGRELPVPGVLYSRIGLTGSATFRYELPAGDETRGMLRVGWQASDVSFNSNSDGSELSFEANLGGAISDNEMVRLEFSDAQVAANTRATPFGFALGDGRLRIADGSSTVAGSAERWKLLDVTANSALQSGDVQGDLQFELLGLDTAEGPYDIEVMANVANVDAELLGPIVRGLQYSRSTATAGSWEPYYGFDADLRGLFSEGVDVNIEDLQLRTPAGDGRMTIAIAVPELDDVASWPALLLALTATANLEIAKSRVDAPSPVSEQLRMLVAGGFLVLDGDVYRLLAEFAKGTATVNGAPFVIPTEMLR